MRRSIEGWVAYHPKLKTTQVRVCKYRNQAINDMLTMAKVLLRLKTRTGTPATKESDLYSLGWEIKRGNLLILE